MTVDTQKTAMMSRGDDESDPYYRAIFLRLFERRAVERKMFVENPCEFFFDVPARASQVGKIERRRKAVRRERFPVDRKIFPEGQVESRVELVPVEIDGVIVRKNRGTKAERFPSPNLFPAGKRRRLIKSVIGLVKIFPGRSGVGMSQQGGEV